MESHVDFFFGSSGVTGTIFLGAGASALCLPASRPQSDLVLGSSSTAAGLISDPFQRIGLDLLFVSCKRVI